MHHNLLLALTGRAGITDTERESCSHFLSNPNTNFTPEAVYKRYEKEKRRSYEERVRKVEHGAFTPLVFSATGAMGKAATFMYQRLPSLLSVKRAQPYSKAMSWLRCQLTFIYTAQVHHHLHPGITFCNE